jgi:hypothetical protein
MDTQSFLVTRMTNTIYRGAKGRIPPSMARDIARTLYEEYLAGQSGPAWGVVAELRNYVAKGNRLGFRSSPVTRGDLLNILDQREVRW